MIPKIIYEDEYFLAVDKPAGLVVDPADTVKEETLADILQKEFGITLLRGGIVHRLDKDTSGILLAAKTQPALEALQNQFKERETKKEYLTLVHGFIEESGEVEGAIARNPGNREKFAVLAEGKEAVTAYEPLEKLHFKEGFEKEIFANFNKIQLKKMEKQRYGEFTLVKCMPKTGRTHQIRVHLKYISHPVVSDEKYGGRKTVRLDKRWCARMFLHAAKIGFGHPSTGQWMELESKLPEDLQTALDYLENG